MDFILFYHPVGLFKRSPKEEESGDPSPALEYVKLQGNSGFLNTISFFFKLCDNGMCSQKSAA